MIFINVIYKTYSGNIYPLNLMFAHSTATNLVYEPERIRELCRIGCTNYGKAGGCPPRAPLFKEITKPEDPVIFVGCLFDSKYKPETVSSSQNSAIHWKFQDGILARLLNNIGYMLVDVYGGKFLATGYCMGCPGKKCSFKLGEENCRNPQKRTYSMEATGINVVQTAKQLLNVSMYWYKKGNTDVPYMLKCIAFLPEKNMYDINVLGEAINKIPNLTCN